MISLAAADNPLLQHWDTPFGLPPFEQLLAGHFAPAFDVTLKAHVAELDALAAQAAPPDFENTIAALDRSGQALRRIERLFYNLTSSETSAELQAVERDMAPRLAAHDNALYMHAGLFSRVDSLHERRHHLGLTPEQLRMLERTHFDFVRAGARLAAAPQARYAAVMERLAALTTRFGQNVLADEATQALVLRSEAELAGLPDFVRAAAAQAARDRGMPGAWVITLSRSQVVDFLSFSDRRDLREQIYRAWTTRGEHPGEHDNGPVAREILALRLEQAQAHGYACYADYALADTMAGTQAAVNGLLQQVWRPAKARAERERADLHVVARGCKHLTAIEAWDWRYFAEKLRQQRYQLDEAVIKPYFPLDRMVQAVFDCALRLFGLQFIHRPEIRAYHPDVKVYEVQRRDGSLVGVFLHDNFARTTKRSGAWMSSYRLQSRQPWPGRFDAIPVVVNNNNFAKGAPDAPALLSFDDARTLFHEFGHGLHGLLSSVGYERLSGTHVLRDFVELPSQLFEHWLSEPEVLKRHARHHQTGEPIPDALVARLKEAQRFNQGFETVRYTASALVDMAAHAVSSPSDLDVAAFEQAELDRLGMPAGIGMNHRLCHFQHLFSGSSYAAGYYVYLWAEVLDADGFDAFVEAGNPFDPTVAKRLLKYVYSSGNSLAPTQAFEAFRGRAATVAPMLKQRGLIEAPA